MLATLEKQNGLHRGNLSLSSTIETFLDPFVSVGMLFVIATLFGEAPAAPYIILSLIVFSLTFPGSLFLRDRFRRMARKTFFNWILIALILLFFGEASGYIDFFHKAVLYTWLGVTPLALVAMNALARWAVPFILAREGNSHTAVIAGCNETGVRLAQNFAANQFIGVRCVGYFDDRSRERLHGIGNTPLLGNLSQLAEYVGQHHVDHIYLALPMATQPRILQLLDNLKDTTASIFFAPDIFVTELIQGRVDSVGGMPVVAVCETPFTGASGIVKRLSDVVLSLLILVLISPLMLAVAIGVKLSSPGPVIFKQRRYGLDGKEIVVYKFRSMTVTEDGDKSYTQVTRNDARVTPFGAFIRRTSLDELPQFINVLQGRMSIVGPRPHAVAVNEAYRKLIPGYMVRHKVKPGITGWAQVNGFRGGDDLDHMTRRIEFDLEYLRNWSLTLDLWIVFKTVWIVFRDRHAY